MRVIRQTLLGLAIAFGLPALGPVFAETLLGRVVAITDGDTVKVLDDELKQHVIRLAGIDAPEKTMPFGNQAKQQLSSLVFRKQVTVEIGKIDRYGRSVGKITVDPDGHPNSPTHGHLKLLHLN